MLQGPCGTQKHVGWKVFVYYLLFQILEASCLLLGLFVSLRLCSGKLMTPITDDVSKLSSLVRPLAFFVFF